jgi:mono/diheme cytochrome c family protein
MLLRHSRWRCLRVALAAFGIGSGGCASATPPRETTAASTSAAVGLYTVAQADRGQVVFGNVCAVCHGTGEFRGPMFELTWMAEPIGDLFQHISTAMPQDDPGSLSPREYAAVVAYLLRLNGRPAGDRELPADVELLEGFRWD